MKKYLLLAPFMAFSLTMSCSSTNHDATVFAANDSRIEIIFDAGNGVFADGLHARSIKLLPGYKWSYVKNIAPKNTDIDCGDYVFAGWLDNERQEIEDDYTFNDPCTVLLADYTVVQRLNVTISAGEDGHWSDGTEADKSLTAIKGETWGKYYDFYVAEPDDSTTNEFKYWTVNEDTEPLSNTYQLQNGDRIVANYGVKGTTNNFETDSWPVFINALNKGFRFCANSNHEQGGYSEEFDAGYNGFIGLERTVRIYNKDYAVRVIDQNVDQISGADSGCCATLTFQFVDAIENAVGWNSNDDNDYTNATIREYLNEQFIDALPDDLIESVVPVDKYTYAGGGRGKNVIKTSESVFLPSLREIGIYEFTIDGKTIVSQDEGVGEYRNLTYQYYFDSTTETLKKKYNGVDCNYWLRSPDDVSLGSAWFVDHEGTIANEEGSYSVQYGLGIAPCFALGMYLGE